MIKSFLLIFFRNVTADMLKKLSTLPASPKKVSHREKKSPSKENPDKNESTDTAGPSSEQIKTITSSVTSQEADELHGNSDDDSLPDLVESSETKINDLTEAKLSPIETDRNAPPNTEESNGPSRSETISGEEKEHGAVQNTVESGPNNDSEMEVVENTEAQNLESEHSKMDEEVSKEQSSDSAPTESVSNENSSAPPTEVLSKETTLAPTLQGEPTKSITLTPKMLALSKMGVTSMMPKLSGGPDNFIDLEEGEEKPQNPGLVKLMQRLEKHAKKKTHKKHEDIELRWAISGYSFVPPKNL